MAGLFDDLPDAQPAQGTGQPTGQPKGMFDDLPDAPKVAAAPPPKQAGLFDDIPASGQPVADTSEHSTLANVANKVGSGVLWNAGLLIPGLDVPAGGGMQSPLGYARQALNSATGYQDAPNIEDVAGEAARRGFITGATNTANSARLAAGQQINTAPAAPDNTYVGKLLQEKIGAGWSDPDWWAAQIAHSATESSPMLAGAAAGEAVTKRAGLPWQGQLAGSAAGGAAGAAIGSLAPHFQQAIQDGLSPHDAFERAWQETGVDAGIAAAFPAVSKIPLFGTATKTLANGQVIETLKRPIAAAMAKIFGIDPALMVANQAANTAIEGKPQDVQDLAATGITGAVQGAGMHFIAGGDHPQPVEGSNVSHETNPVSAPFADLPDATPLNQKVEQAAAHVASPTDAQKESGNYAKGHVNIQGLPVTIETPRGAERSGTDPNGDPWSVTMPDHYGYIKKTEGADGDHVDTYIGPQPENKTAYVVDQVDADTGKFDEHKVMLGYPDRPSAMAAYDQAFSDGRAQDRIGGVSEMPVSHLKDWLNNGDTTKPLAGTETAANGQQAAEVSRMHDVAAKVAQPISDAPDSPKAAYISDVFDAMQPKNTEPLAAIGSWFGFGKNKPEQIPTQPQRPMSPLEELATRVNPLAAMKLPDGRIVEGGTHVLALEKANIPEDQWDNVEAGWVVNGKFMNRKETQQFLNYRDSDLPHRLVTEHLSAQKLGQRVEQTEDGGLRVVPYDESMQPKNTEPLAAVGASVPPDQDMPKMAALKIGDHVFTGANHADSQEAAERALGKKAVDDGTDPLAAITAYHGTPHDIPLEQGFRPDKIGTGEGAQAYGHGYYFAQNEKVAKGYQDQLSGNNIDARNYFSGGKQADLSAKTQAAIDAARPFVSHPDQARAVARNIIDSMSQMEGVPASEYHSQFQAPAAFKDAYSAAANALGDLTYKQNPGRLYQVHLDVEPHELLDWDKPISAQGPIVRSAVEKLTGNKVDVAGVKAHTDALYDALFGGGSDKLPNDPWDPTGESLYQMLLARGKTGNAEALRQQGVHGIRYLDQGSRTSGEGTHNIVMFPGTEDKIKITHVDGTPVTAKEKAAYLAATGSGDKSDVMIKRNLQTTIKMGMSHDVPEATVQGIHDALRPHLHVLPDYYDAGVITKIEPFRDKDYPRDDARVTYTNQHGEEKQITAPSSFLARTRAIHVGSENLVLFNRLGALGPGDTGKVLSGELRHELVHVLRQTRELGGSAWNTLVAHANKLRLLDGDLSTYLQRIGNADAAKYAEGTLREAYEKIYKGRPDFQGIMDEESVAHMAELYHHGELLPQEYGPVKGLLDRLVNGDFGKSDKGKSEPSQPMAAASGSGKPPRLGKGLSDIEQEQKSSGKGVEKVISGRKVGEDATTPTATQGEPDLDAFKKHLTDLAKSGDIKLIPAKIAKGDTGAVAKARRSAIVIDGKPVHRIVIPKDRAEASQNAEPPVNPGFTRVYHGGDTNDARALANHQGDLWVTRNPQYARDFRAGNKPNTVWHVDIPNDHPALVAANGDMANGIAPRDAFKIDQTSARRAVLNPIGRQHSQMPAGASSKPLGGNGGGRGPRPPAGPPGGGNGATPPGGEPPRYGDTGITGRLHSAIDRFGMGNIVRDIQMKLTPMAARDASTAARAGAKDFANEMRVARWDQTRIDENIKRDFTPAQQEKMWKAADEESVLRQTGRDTRGRGLDRLSPQERSAVERMQAASQAEWQNAKAVGIVDAEKEGLPSYTPRMIAMITGERPKAGTGQSGGKAINAIGNNLKTFTSQLLRRKHLTTEETEAAAKAKIGDDANVVQNIRTLPLATTKLREAVAGRRLINEVKRIGEQSGDETVREGSEPADSGYKWFTIDHPAFKVFRPKFTQNPETGRMESVQDQHGQPVFEKVPLYVRSDFEGPLRAVLSRDTGAIYGGLMAIKGKAMGVIMYSPLIHNMVEYGRAFPTMPGRMITGRVYFDGHALKNDPAQMQEAINNGLVPIGHRGSNQDITSMMEEPNIKPGRSWTAQAAGALPNLFDPKAGDAVKRWVDNAGNFWHNTLLWDRVADLQAGLYKNFRDDMVAKGIDPQTASRTAAHFANRYAGALPAEAMSSLSRKIANVAMFSRSFTLGNLGAMKDMVRGLPDDVKAQIERDAGLKTLNKVTNYAQRKAIAVVATDIALFYAANSMLQNAVQYFTGRQDLSQIEKGYVDRLSGLVSRAENNPASVLNPFDDAQSLTSMADNESGKQDRVLVGYQSDGTAIYARNPIGKIGEEFKGWLTSPLDMVKRKLSPFAQPLLETISNDRGFGRKVYDTSANASTVANLGRIVGLFMGAELPVPSIQSAAELAQGQETPDQRNIDLYKTLGPLAGVTFSKGAPGGPAMGEIYAAKDEHDFAVQQALPGIKDMIRQKNIAQARKQMTALSIPSGLQNYYIRTTLNPASKESGKTAKEALQYMTPEERAAFLRDRSSQPSTNQ